MDWKKLYEKIKYVVGWSVSGFLGGVVYSLGITNFASTDLSTALYVAMGFGAVKVLKELIKYIEDWTTKATAGKVKKSKLSDFLA